MMMLGNNTYILTGGVGTLRHYRCRRYFFGNMVVRCPVEIIVFHLAVVHIHRDHIHEMYSSRESSKRTSPLTISHGTGSYNGSWRARRDGPPADAPPSPPAPRPMERSIGGGSQGSGSLLLERSITPLSLGSMSSLHDVLKVGTDMGDALHSEDSSCGASPPHPADP